MHGKHTSSSTLRKFNQIISTYKIMCTVFCVRKSAILMEFALRNKTVNVAVYVSLKTRNGTCLVVVSLYCNIDIRQFQDSCRSCDIKSHRAFQLAGSSVVLSFSSARFTRVSVSPYKLICYGAFLSHWRRDNAQAFFRWSNHK